jgi:hypothetical protein
VEAGLGDTVDAVYRALGGIQPVWTARPGAWDLVFDGVAVELDEQLHFNRYRATSLDSAMYAQFPRFPLMSYRAQCRSFENACLKAGGYGGKWSNPSCERQFGAGAPQGDLNGGGAPRWKQRAFYDFIKDLAPVVIGLPVARISIWDVLAGDGPSRTVGDVLSKPTEQAGEALFALLHGRAGFAPTSGSAS